jgi:hypothetical protein
MFAKAGAGLTHFLLIAVLRCEFLKESSEGKLLLGLN